MGGRLQHPFLAPSHSGKKASAKQRQKSGETPLILSLTSHSVHMKASVLRLLPWLLATLLLGTAWVLVIWCALQVSAVVLDTLEMIVELAAISP